MSSTIQVRVPNKELWPEPIYSGYCSKHTVVIKKVVWRKRFFILDRSGKLFYFSNNKSKKPKKTPVIIKGKKFWSSNNRNNCLEIERDPKPFLLIAEDGEKMKEWASKFQEVGGISYGARYSPLLGFKKAKPPGKNKKKPPKKNKMMKTNGEEYTHKVTRGWFKKKGNGSHLVSKDRKRWFVMNDTTIVYYADQNEEICKGNIYINNIQEVKVNGSSLLLRTDYRLFDLKGEDVQSVIDWAEEIEKRLRDTEAVRKVVQKANKVIEKAISIENHSKTLAEYVSFLEMENTILMEENDEMKKEIQLKLDKNKTEE